MPPITEHYEAEINPPKPRKPRKATQKQKDTKKAKDILDSDPLRSAIKKLESTGMVSTSNKTLDCFDQMTYVSINQYGVPIQHSCPVEVIKNLLQNELGIEVEMR